MNKIGALAIIQAVENFRELLLTAFSQSWEACLPHDPRRSEAMKALENNIIYSIRALYMVNDSRHNCLEAITGCDISARDAAGLRHLANLLDPQPLVDVSDAMDMEARIKEARLRGYKEGHREGYQSGYEDWRKLAEDSRIQSSYSKKLSDWNPEKEKSGKRYRKH